MAVEAKPIVPGSVFMIPRKLSVNDPGFAVIRTGEMKLYVQLDGKSVSRCVAYDQDEGWVEQFQKDAATGKLAVDATGENYVIERVHGVVTVGHEKPADWEAF